MGLGDSALKKGLGPGRTLKDSGHAHTEHSRFDSQLVVLNEIDWGDGAEELKGAVHAIFRCELGEFFNSSRCAFEWVQQ